MKLGYMPLTALTNLTVLDLEYNQIMIYPLSNLTNLTNLVVDNKITDLSPLYNLTNLVELRLLNNKITDIFTYIITH